MENRTFTYNIFGAVFLALMLVCSMSMAQNDNCANAATISLPTNGYGLGSNITSATFSIDAATNQAGETFHPSVPSGKTIWYKFHLPTTRHIAIGLRQSTIRPIAGGNVGYTLYYSPSFACIPPQANRVDPVATMLNDFNDRRCFLAGDYLIQVSADLAATGDVFIEFLTLAPSSSVQGDTLYDFPFEAHNFSLVSNDATGRSTWTGEWETINYQQGCQSIFQFEDSCSDKSDYNKSSWHVFTTDTHIDYFRAQVRETPFGGGTTWQYSLYQGDVRVDPTTLNGVDSCRDLTQNASQGFPNGPSAFYECLLEPNTTYSMQLIYPRDYKSAPNNVEVGIYELGRTATISPDPLNVTANGRNLGVLPSGLTTSTDIFACNAQMKYYDAALGCPTLMQDTMTFGGTSYDLSTWMTFTLGQDANFDIQWVSNDCQPNAYLRLFSGDVQGASPCTNLTLVDEWNNGGVRNLDCLPAGTYTIQILGQINRNWWSNNCATNLAADFTMRYTVNNVPGEDFSMRTPAAIDVVNTIDFTTVFAIRDTFDCLVTPMPAFTCGTYDRAMYRTFTVTQNGIIEIGSFDCNYRYVLYSGAPTVVGAVATGLTNLNTCTCGLMRQCITPGTYTLVTFADITDVGRPDRPSFLWRPYAEKYGMRTASEFNAVNGLVPLPVATNIDATRDTFDCQTTPIPSVGATGSCNKTRAMYRVIEIGSAGWLSITNLDWNLNYRLYQGDVSNTIAHPNVGGFIQNLVPVDLCNSNSGCTVSGCFSPFFSSTYYTCVQPGRYTLVTFGDPSLFDDIGNSDRPRFRFDTYTHNFGFTTLADYDQFNAGAALANAITYPSVATVMDCQTSKAPQTLCNATCNDKFTYRYFQTSASGDLVITGLNGSLQYRLFTGTPGGVSFSGNTVMGLTPYVSTCNAVNCFGGTSRTINCLPAGDYFLVTFGNSCDVGRPDNPSIRLNQLPVQDFNLSAVGAVDSINGMNPLMPATNYSSKVDTFDCAETVRPTNGCFGSLNSCVSSANRAMYRIINIGQNGVLTVFPGAYYGCHNVRHVLYRGNAQDTAIAYGLLGNSAAQLPNMLDISGCQHADCWFGCNPQPFKHCVTPGTYTLVTLGNCSDIGQQDQPTFRFDIIGAAPYTTPATAEIMPSLTTSVTSITATKTWVECSNNPMPVMGNAPCGGATKQFYREFYLATPTCGMTFTDLINIYQTPQSGCTNFTHSLYSGQISNGSLTGAVQTCFTTFSNNNCMPVGWYTVVTYGEGYTFASNSYCGDYGDDVLDTTYWRINITPAPVGNFNTFAKAELVNGGLPISWEPKPSRGHTTASPVQDTVFCLTPSVWGKCDNEAFPAGITPCANATAYDRASYRVFTLAKPSYVYIYGINTADHHDNGVVANQYQSRLYDGNVTDGSIIAPFTAVHDCIYNDMRTCLPAGTYTLVTFTHYTTGACSKQITPRIYLDSMASSKYDHALTGYDFGEIPNNNVAYPGAVGYTLDGSGRPPANDFITCSTGSQLSDPDNVQHEAVHNLVSNSADGFFYNLPRATDPRRNLWYTFTARGGGDIIVKVVQKTSTNGAQDPCGTIYGCNWDLDYKTTKPNFAVYSNDDLTATDSTYAQGLTFLMNNENPFFNACYALYDSVTINRSACGSPLERYHVLVDLPLYNEPNVQYEVIIRYKNSGVAGIEYDNYSSANHIARVPGLQADAPPYPNDTLDNTVTSTGSWVVLECLTEDVTDQEPAGCGFGTDMHSAWYTFYVDHGGEMLISYDRSGNTGLANCNASQFGNFRYDNTEMILFKSAFPGDSTSSGLFPMTSLGTVTNDPVGQQWRRFCYDAGRYYLMVTGCDCYADSIRPHIKFRPREGDHCFDPVTLTIPDGVPPAGTVVSDQVPVDCWTIGEAIGEDGSNMGCLDGPIGYKSGWFMIDLQETGLVDVNIEFNLGTLVGVAQGDVSFRTATNTCDALTFTGECVTQLNDNITLACRTNQIIYIQVTLPVAATGQIGLTVTTTPNTVVPPCTSPNPNQPISSFVANADCVGSVTTFTNNSTVGSGVTYQWDFGDGFTSNLFNPTHIYTAAGTYTAVLIVNNGTASDTTAILVNVYDQPTANFDCTPMSPIILGNSITFANTSSDTLTGGASTYNWNFCRGADSRILLAGTLSSPTGTNAATANLNSGTYWDVFNPQLQPAGTHYIQFDAGALSTIIGVGSQGGGGIWVQSYKVSYSTTGAFYNFIKDASGNDIIFTGNTDVGTIINNYIGNYDARYVRIYPWTWNSSNRFRMRVGVYTCDASIPRFDGQAPPAVTYSQVGSHLTCLTVGNGLCYDTICKPIDVYQLTPFGGGPYDGEGTVYQPKVCPIPVNIFAGGPEDPCQVTESLVANIGCAGSTVLLDTAFTCPTPPDTCNQAPIGCEGCFFAGGSLGGASDASLPPPAVGGPVILTGDTICIGSAGTITSNPATNWYQQTSPGVFMLLATNTTSYTSPVINNSGSVYYYADDPFTCGPKIPVEIAVQNQIQPAFVTNSGCIGGTGGPSTFTNLTPVPGPASATIGTNLTSVVIGTPPTVPGRIAFSSQNGATNFSLFTNNDYDNATIAWQPNNAAVPATHWVVWRYSGNKSVNRLFIQHDSTTWGWPAPPTNNIWRPEAMRLFYFNGSGWVQVKAWTQPEYAFWDTGFFFETAGLFSNLWKLEIDESTDNYSPKWREFQIYASDEVIAGPGLTASWTFGDGSTSTAINPVHQYVTAGTYNVTLTAGMPGVMCNNSIVLPVTVTDCSILLPVQLLSFDAEVIDNGDAVRTRWVTEMEKDNDYFTVERSADGIHFTEIGVVQSQGNSNSNQYYELYDNNPLFGNSYYRLKETSTIGNWKYSGIVAVYIAKPDDQVAIVPNPNNGAFELQVMTEHVGDYDLLVYDPLGKLVLQQELSVIKGQNTYSLDIRDFPSGVYVLTLKSQGGARGFTRKVVKIKN